mgnify:CR=1 FL=1|tara:strand:+ start:5082 stop:5318 length:237 start_codon:yes stop_codon:yes gene_type:complete
MYIDEVIRECETWKEVRRNIEDFEGRMAEKILLSGGDANLAHLTSDALDKMTLEKILNDEKLLKILKEDVLEEMKLFG